MGQTRNAKPDALSRQWENSSVDQVPQTIIPWSGIVVPVRWGVEYAVRRASLGGSTFPQHFEKVSCSGATLAHSRSILGSSGSWSLLSDASGGPT